jgi:hypothetical protein
MLWKKYINSIEKKQMSFLKCLKSLTFHPSNIFEPSHIIPHIIPLFSWAARLRQASSFAGSTSSVCPLRNLTSDLPWWKSGIPKIVKHGP